MSKKPETKVSTPHPAGFLNSPLPLWERAFRRDLAREACASRMAGRVRGNQRIEEKD